jgi:hypothetical protein
VGCCSTGNCWSRASHWLSATTLSGLVPQTCMDANGAICVVGNRLLPLHFCQPYAEMHMHTTAAVGVFEAGE